MSVTYNPAAVANRFLAYGNDNDRLLSPMQVLKLVYIAHGWYLAGTDEPLIDEEVQAWKYGPIVPSLFHEFKEYGQEPVQRFARVPAHWNDTPDNGTGFSDISGLDAPMVTYDEPADEYLFWVWKKYGQLSLTELTKFTHRDGTPWHETVQEMHQQHNGQWLSHYPIHSDRIRAYYKLLWSNSRTSVPA